MESHVFRPGTETESSRARFPGPTVLWHFRETTATSYSDAPLNVWGSNLNQAFANFWKNFYTCPQLAALTMKATKERFSRFHLLRLRRQSTTLLLVNLFFKTICGNRRIKSRRPLRVLAALLAWLSLGPFAAYATDFFWHTPSGGDWGFNGNWSGGPHPETFSDTASFNEAGSPPLAPVTLVSVQTPPPVPTIGTLNLNVGGFTFQNGTLQLGGAATINVQSHNPFADFAASATIQLFSNATISTSLANSTLSVAGGITGAFGLTKTGPGKLTLSGTNTYTGNTAVTAGTLLVNGSVGAGSVNVSSGATLGGTGAIGGPVTIQNGGILSPGVSPVPGTLTTGSLTLNSGSILNYKFGIPNVVNSGVNDLVTVMGNLTLAGTLNVTDVGGFGAGVYRVFNYSGSLTNNTLNLGSLPSGFGLSVDTAHANQVNLVVSGGLPTQFWDGSNTTPGSTAFGRGGNGTWNNVPTNTNWTTQDGTPHNAAWGNGFAIFAGTAGTVTLGDNIHFTGMQFLTDGYLVEASGSQTLLASPDTKIRTDVGVTATISAPIANDSSPAKLTKTDAGTLVLVGNNTYTGGTIIAAGTLELGNGGTSGSVVGNITDNAALVFNRSDEVTYGGIVSGSGSLAQFGTGTLTLSGMNTYIGGTFLNEGVIAVAFDHALGDPNGPLTFNGGTLWFDAQFDLSTTRPITLELGGGTINTQSFITTISQEITGSGTLTKAGTGTLALIEDNTYSGGTTISGGTLQLGNGGTSGSIIGNVTDNGVLAFNRSDSVTFGGVISGTGGVAQIGAGTTILTGNSTYTGGTTISAGTLQIGAGATTGSIVGNVGNNGILLFNRSDSVAFGGVISGTGSLVKHGAGTLTLPGKNTYTGTTTIDAGSLIVDGSIASEQTFVNAGAFLGGHGTIGGNLSNSGTVGPGDSLGTLTVASDYTQNAAGTLRIQVGGLGANQHDLLAVNGHVTLGGTLQLLRLGGFNLQPGNQIVFLTAQKGVSGAFNTIQNDFATGTIVQGVVVTSSDAVVLEGQQGSFTQIPGVTLTPNQVAVGNMLNSAVGNPAAAPLIAFLNSQPVANLPQDYNLIAPTQISSVNATAVSVGNVQMSNLGGRLANIHAGSTGFSSAGFAISGGAASFGEGFAGVSGPEGKSGLPVFAPVPSNRWGVFVTGLGEFTNVDSTPNAPGYDVNTGGFTLGVDYRLTPNFAIGLTAGYAHTSVAIASPGGNVDVNAGKIGMYATLFGKGLYLDTAVSGGPSGYTTRRTALQGTANGSTNGGDLDALVAVGYDWQKGNLTIGPTASFQYDYVGLNGFTETGSLAPLKFPNQNTESERTAFGAKAFYNWKIGSITAIPQFSAAWQHEFGSTEYSVVASLASGAGNSFTVFGPPIGHDSLLIGAGATVILNERVSTYIYYDGEFARTKYLSNNVSGGVRISF